MASQCALAPAESVAEFLIQRLVEMNDMRIGEIYSVPSERKILKKLLTM